MNSSKVRKAVNTKLRTLVFTATYNERGNVETLLDQVFGLDPAFEMLFVDDNSPDGTSDLLNKLAADNPRLHVIVRPAKLGIGSAHRLAFDYAIHHGFDRLVTMDADLSHNPAEIPDLLAGLEKADLVIGSRYTEGGSSDYKGYRRFISICGNKAARILLRLEQKEFTTSFRAFDVPALKVSRCDKLRGDGYSFFMETVFRLNRAGLKITEVPIQFKDRLYGISKIPKFEVFSGISKLLWLAMTSVVGLDKFTPTNDVDDICAHCDSPYLVEIFSSSHDKETVQKSAHAYRCSSMEHKSKPQIVRCFQCGLVQIPKSKRPRNLLDIYRSVDDPTYLENRKARELNFEKTYQKIAPFLPKPGRMLEVGAYCGLFLGTAKRFDWDCVGVEPSHWAAQIAREQIGVSVLTGTLEENRDKLEGPFDVVACWDVLEHVDAPFQLLLDINEVLRDGGVFVFCTLDIDNWFAKLLGRHWPWYMDMHLSYFTRDLLLRWLDEAGFDTIQTMPYRHYASLRYIWKKGVAILPSSISWLLKPLEYIFPTWLILPISFGDIKMFIAKKRDPASANHR